MTKRYSSFNVTVFIFTTVLLSSCAGTIKTVSYPEKKATAYTKAYIISAANSQFIRFKPGIILPMGYIVPPDDPSVKHKVIGNTDLVIRQELEKYGIKAEIVTKGTTLNDFDLIVEYYDTWRWDFKKILDKLEIVFIAGTGNVIAKSTYNIYRNKELHNFPTPEKEVPKMIKEMLAQ